MNEKIAEGMINKMAGIDSKTTYASLKTKEEKLVEQLRVLREEIANAEKDIIKEKINIAIQCLVEVEKMSGSYYDITIEKYCGGCEDYIDVNFELSEIIDALQQIG